MAKKGEVKMKVFRRRSRALKNWHNRAMMIDPKRTKLVFLSNGEIRHIPSWVYEEFST